MSLISMHGAWLSFSDAPLLDNAELHIEDNERVCLVGRNGAGKSTLMKILNREQGLDDGRIIYEQDLIVARLQQDPPRNVEGSVYDFVAEGIEEQAEYLKRYHDISRLVMNDPSEKNLNELAKVQEQLDHHNLWQLENRINEVLAQLGLDPNVALSSLSGGWLRKAALGRALVSNPRVLLLDEPLSALDAQIRHNMVEEIARLHRELPELTILYVTHDQTEALTLADKIGIMKDGSLIAHGETHELYHYPPNRFSAEFLGRANILQATALKDSPEPGLVSVSCGGGLINAFSRGGLHGNNKLLCIRPQHMSLAPRSATSNRLNATLTSVHWQGDLTHLLCDVAGEAVRIVMTHVNPLPRAGDKLALYFEPGDAVLIEVQ